MRRVQRLTSRIRWHLNTTPLTASSRTLRRYEIVDRVLATIKAEHAEEVGFVGNERYLNF